MGQLERSEILMGIYRVRTSIVGLQGAPYLSTHYFAESGGTAAQAATAVSTFWTALAARVADQASGQVESSVSTLDETDGSLQGETAVTTDAINFSNTGEHLPYATQGLIQWRTSNVVGKRIARGRTFVPGATEDAATFGYPNSTYVAALQTAASALIANANCILVVWHRPTEANPSSGQVSPVSTATVWTQWAVLRSRRD